MIQVITYKIIIFFHNSKYHNHSSKQNSKHTNKLLFKNNNILPTLKQRSITQFITTITVHSTQTENNLQLFSLLNIENILQQLKEQTQQHTDTAHKEQHTSKKFSHKIKTTKISKKKITESNKINLSILNQFQSLQKIIAIIQI